MATQVIPQEVQVIVDALDDKRAKDVVVLDLREVSASLDYFVVASGESSVQLKAMQDEVKERMKAAGFKLKAIEGPSERWILMDYGFIVAHLMSPDARAFYDLEELWADAEAVPVAAS